MRSILTLILVLPLLAVFAPVQAQEFEVTPDSTSGVGIANETNIFRSLIVNRWDQENRINWHLETELPEGWAVQICQWSYTCWPSWVTDETMILGAGANDSLLVEFLTKDNAGVGVATITMVAEANNDIRRELTFELRVGVDGVSPDPKNTTGLKFDLKSAFFRSGSEGSILSLPKDSEVIIALYDLNGRQTRVIRQGFFTVGEHFINLADLSLPTGMYVLRASCELGVASQRLMLFR